MRRIIYLALLCALAGCANPRLMGGAPCNPLWDRIDYRKCYEDSLKAAGKMPEKPAPGSEDEFGSCSPSDLPNHTCK